MLFTFFHSFFDKGHVHLPSPAPNLLYITCFPKHQRRDYEFIISKITTLHEYEMDKSSTKPITLYRVANIESSGTLRIYSAD